MFVCVYVCMYTTRVLYIHIDTHTHREGVKGETIHECIYIYIHTHTPKHTHLHIYDVTCKYIHNIIFSVQAGSDRESKGKRQKLLVIVAQTALTLLRYAVICFWLVCIHCFWLMYVYIVMYVCILNVRMYFVCTDCLK